MEKEARRSIYNPLRKGGGGGNHRQVQNCWTTLTTCHFPSDVGHGDVTQPLASLSVYAHKDQEVRTHIRNPACMANSASFSKGTPESSPEVRGLAKR